MTLIHLFKGKLQPHEVEADQHRRDPDPRFPVQHRPRSRDQPRAFKHEARNRADKLHPRKTWKWDFGEVNGWP